MIQVPHTIGHGEGFGDSIIEYCNRGNLRSGHHALQQDQTKLLARNVIKQKICQIRSVATHFGYFRSNTLLCSFSVGWIGYPHSPIRYPNVRGNCLTKITPQDEKQV